LLNPRKNRASKWLTSSIHLYDFAHDRPSSRLQDEIRQRTPFRSPEHESLLALLHTADVVRRAHGSVVEPHGITGQQYNVLRILRGARPEQVPTLEIARRMIERTPGITRLLDRLEAKKLVARHRCPTDRRQVLCEITARGLELLASLDEQVRHAEDTTLSKVPRR
jgi:DNA-binding MarR family transcriptional regulator